jgi:hypothetical protein
VKLVKYCAVRILLLLSFFVSNSFANDHKVNYSIAEILAIIEKNPAIKSAEFMAIAQRNLALQEKYWQNPQINFGSGNNTQAIKQANRFLLLENWKVNLISKIVNLKF